MYLWSNQFALTKRIFKLQLIYQKWMLAAYSTNFSQNVKKGLLALKFSNFQNKIFLLQMGQSIQEWTK